MQGSAEGRGDLELHARVGRQGQGHGLWQVCLLHGQAAVDPAPRRADERRQAVQGRAGDVRYGLLRCPQRPDVAQFYHAKTASSAYGKCVSTNAKKNQEAADQKNKDQVTAAKFCKGQQSQPDFKTNYKTFGACVSKKAHELDAARQQQQSAQSA